jgi:hypothetical protein
MMLAQTLILSERPFLATSEYGCGFSAKPQAMSGEANTGDYE